MPGLARTLQRLYDIGVKQNAVGIYLIRDRKSKSIPIVSTTVGIAMGITLRRKTWLNSLRERNPGEEAASQAIGALIGKDPTTISYGIKHHRSEHRNRLVIGDGSGPEALRPPYVCYGCPSRGFVIRVSSASSVGSKQMFFSFRVLCRDSRAVSCIV